MFNMFKDILNSNVSVSDPALIYNTKEFMVSIVKTLRPDMTAFVFSVHFFVLMSSFEAIAGGVAGFWGCVLGLGSLYIVIVLFRRSLNSIKSSSDDNKEDI